MKGWFGFLFLFSMFSFSYADTLQLKNGRSMEGIIKREDSQSIELEVGVGCSIKFLKSEVNNISRSSPQDSLALRAKWEKEKLAGEKQRIEEGLAEERKPRTVEFSRGSQGILLNVNLDDTIEARMVLDTGASIMLITRNVAGKLRINLDGAQPDMTIQTADGRKISAKHIVIGKVEVQGAQVRNVDAAVLLSEAGDMGFGDGLLGMSFLKHFNFRVDQKEKKLILEKL